MKHALFFLLLFLASCSEKTADSGKPESEEILFSFFAAGHTYGDPMQHQYGLYPPFVMQFDQLNTDDKLALGVFTGDIVAKPTLAYWDSAFIDIDELEMPIYITPGNHDRGFEFEKRNLEYFYAFEKEQCLFISLSPTNWNIEGEQLAFLDSCLTNLPTNCKHVFLFVHELIWWSPEGEYSEIKINYEPHYPGSTNYWPDIHPKLAKLQIPVSIIAGDVGCRRDVSPFSYHTKDNVTFISSGMGSGTHDNYLRVDINSNYQVKYTVVGFGTENSVMIELSN